MPESKSPIETKKRCAVYIDGFNWYFGVFQHHPEWKWLNVQTFFEALRPDEEVVAVRFYTALIEPKKNVSPIRERQLRYLEALATLPKVKIVLGKYQDRTVTCRALCRQKYLVPEEKKTDVNIAVSLIDDTLNNLADTMLLVSGDSDLEPAVEWVRRTHPHIKFKVYIPTLENQSKWRQNHFYQKIGVHCRNLPLFEIGEHQLPPKIKLNDGRLVERPSEWA
jgi:6-hydroxy-3-succinoylpyridine 3-monooxygenase